MADLMQQVRELLPCPFCGNTVQDDEGCFQSAGFRPHSTAVWSVRCGNPSCNADVSGTSADDAVDAWNRRSAMRAAPEAEALRVAMTTLEQIATTPRNKGARMNAKATLLFLQTQLAARPQGVK